MLETFRKYTGLMFVVLILLFVGLVFFGSGNQGLISGPTVMEAHGKGYSQQEFNRLSGNPARMLRSLAGNPFQNRDRFQMIDGYLRRMGVATWDRIPLTGDQLTNFLVNRVSFQKAMKSYGLHTSTADIEQYLQEKLFWVDDSFDSGAYNEFVEKSLPRLGMGVKEMNEVIGEIIALEKFGDVLATGIEPSREAVAIDYLNRTQRIDYQLVSFPLTKYEVDQDPSEEDIKKHWSENKGKYKSQPERRITYVLTRPDYAKLEAAKKAAEDAKPKPAATTPGTPKPGVTPGAIAPKPAAPTPSAPKPAAPKPAAPQPAAPNNEEGDGETPCDDGSCGQDEDVAPEPADETEPAPEPTAPKPTAPKPAAPKSAAPKPAAPEPTAPEPAAPKPVAPKPVLSQPRTLPPGAPRPALPGGPRPGFPGIAPKPADSVLSPEEREKAVVEMGAKLDGMWDQLDEKEGEGFEEIAKEMDFEVKTTTLFTKDTIPAELKADLRDTPGKTGTDVVFEHDPGDTLFDATSDVRRIGNDQWLLFRIDEAVEEVELPYEKARDEAKLELVKARASEAMEKEAKAKQEAAVAAMEAGKTFADAAKELELKPIKRVNVTRPGQEGAAQTEFDLSAKTNAAKISSVEIEDNETLGIKRAFFVLVEKREVIEDPGLDGRIDIQVDQRRTQLRELAISNWFSQQTASANIKLPTQ